jgi:hypothetical protein
MTGPGQSYSRDDALRELDEIRRRQGEPPRVTKFDHWDADEVLLKLIDDPWVSAAWRQIGKWSA